MRVSAAPDETGQPNGGNINNLNNIDYYRRTYSLFAQNDWRITPKLNLNQTASDAAVRASELVVEIRLCARFHH